MVHDLTKEAKTYCIKENKSNFTAYKIQGKGKGKILTMQDVEPADISGIKRNISNTKLMWLQRAVKAKISDTCT
jgi:hypothetical protein